jgi:DNA-binding GntR family transcriptional regulator
MRKLKQDGKNDTLGGRARDELRRAIMSGQFQPGEKITIRSIASALNISLTPAREALFNLAAEGVLDLKENGSLYIPALDRARIDELAKIRISLECLAARDAIKNITPKEIAELAETHDRLAQANKQKNFKAVIRLNWEFHFAIYEAARLPTLYRMIEACWLKTGTYLNLIYPSFGDSDAGISNHKQMMDAIGTRNSDELVSAIRRDIELSSSALLASVAESSPEESVSA